VFWCVHGTLLLTWVHSHRGTERCSGMGTREHFRSRSVKIHPKCCSLFLFPRRWLYKGSVATILALAEQHNCCGLKKACLQFLSSPSVRSDVMATDGFEHLARSCPSVLKDLIFNVPTRAPVSAGEKSQVDMGQHGMFSSGRRTKYCYRVLVLLVLLLVLSLKGSNTLCLVYVWLPHSSWVQLFTEKTSYYLVSKK
jgi:hypothetical protein